MKVLFLDIDGVLNRHNTPELVPETLYTGLAPDLLERYKMWLFDKDCEVVLSSTWRRFPPFMDHLEENGIVWTSVTPKFSSHRGLEIAWWLNHHPEVTHCAILDDTNLMKPVGRCLVQTSPWHGLQQKHLRKVDKLLGYE